MCGLVENGEREWGEGLLFIRQRLQKESEVIDRKKKMDSISEESLTEVLSQIFQPGYTTNSLT